MHARKTTEWMHAYGNWFNILDITIRRWCFPCSKRLGEFLLSLIRGNSRNKSQTFIIIVLNSPEITNLQGLGQRCFWDDDGIGSVNSVRILDDVILSHRSWDIVVCYLDIIMSDHLVNWFKDSLTSLYQSALDSAQGKLSSTVESLFEGDAHIIYNHEQIDLAKLMKPLAFRQP